MKWYGDMMKRGSQCRKEGDGKGSSLDSGTVWGGCVQSSYMDGNTLTPHKTVNKMKGKKKIHDCWEVASRDTYIGQASKR